MTPLLFIQTVGTITVYLHRIKEHSEVKWISVSRRLPHPFGRYSSLGIMQPNTLEKFSVGQRLGLDLADWGMSRVSLLAGWSKTICV